MAVKTVVGITISLLVYVPLALSTPCPPSGCPTQDTDDVELIQKRIDVESSLQLDQGTSAATKANTPSVAASSVIVDLRMVVPTTGAREYLTGVLEEERNKIGCPVNASIACTQCDQMVHTTANSKIGFAWRCSQYWQYWNTMYAPVTTRLEQLSEADPEYWVASISIGSRNDAYEFGMGIHKTNKWGQNKKFCYFGKGEKFPTPSPYGALSVTQFSRPWAIRGEFLSTSTSSSWTGDGVPVWADIHLRSNIVANVEGQAACVQAASQCSVAASLHTMSQCLTDAIAARNSIRAKTYRLDQPFSLFVGTSVKSFRTCFCMNSDDYKECGSLPVPYDATAAIESCVDEVLIAKALEVDFAHNVFQPTR